MLQWDLFTQTDPIGIAGGLNLYGYAGGDPINFSDPFGLMACDPPESCPEALPELFTVKVRFGGRVGFDAAVAGFGASVGGQVGPQGEITLGDEATLTVSDFELSFDFGVVGPAGSGFGARCDVLSTCSGYGSAPGPGIEVGSSSEQRGRFGSTTRIGVQVGIGAELGISGQGLLARLIRYSESQQKRIGPDGYRR